MTNELGLSIGTRHLVAVAPGAPPTVRRSVLTAFPHRPAEVGVPSENSRLNEPGLVFAGFVERVGDPVPLVASDGSTHLGEQLLATAMEALTRTVRPNGPSGTMTAAIPAHWRESTVDALRRAVAASSVLSLNGQPMPLVPDAVAALTALRAKSALPTVGVIALVDLGATGTSITLADAAADFRRVGETVRYDEFSGDLVDQAVLRHMLTVLDVDPSQTSAVAALSRIREESRMAKERLSNETATTFTGPLSGPHSTMRLTRAELETLLRDPIDGLLAVIEDTVQRNNVALSGLSAVATVGGGAHIPLVTQRLSSALRVAVVTHPMPEVAAAVGAAMLAFRGTRGDAATRAAMAPATVTAPAAALAATSAHTAAAAVEPLACSEDRSSDGVAASYGSDADDLDSLDTARPAVYFEGGGHGAVNGPWALPWYRRPGVLFAAAASAVLLASVGFLLTGRIGDVPATPVVTTVATTPTAAPVPPPAPVQPPPPTVETVIQQPVPNQQARVPRVAPSPGPTPATSTTVVTSSVVTSSSPTTTTTTSEECTPSKCITVEECDPSTCIIDGPDPGGTTGSTSQGGDGGTTDGSSRTDGGATQGGGASEGGAGGTVGGGTTESGGRIPGSLGSGPEIDCPGYAGCELPDGG